MWFILGLVSEDFKSCNFYKGLDRIIAVISECNVYFQSEEPWKLKKDTSKSDHLQVVLYTTMEVLRVTNILLQPVIPNLAAKVLGNITFS